MKAFLAAFLVSLACAGCGPGSDSPNRLEAPPSVTERGETPDFGVPANVIRTGQVAGPAGAQGIGIPAFAVPSGEPSSRELLIQVSPRRASIHQSILVTGETTHQGSVEVGLSGPVVEQKAGVPYVERPRRTMAELPIEDGKYETSISLDSLGSFISDGEFSVFARIGDLEVYELIVVGR